MKMKIWVMKTGGLEQIDSSCREMSMRFAKKTDLWSLRLHPARGTALIGAQGTQLKSSKVLVQSCPLEVTSLTILAVPHFPIMFYCLYSHYLKIWVFSVLPPTILSPQPPGSHCLWTTVSWS